MRKTLLTLVTASLVATMPIRAQEPASMERCRSIKDNTERLSCYDMLATAARPGTVLPAGRGYQAVSLIDLKLDHDSLRGRGIEVSGNLLLAGEMALLRSGATDTTPLYVDLKAIPREQRRALLEHCTGLGCAVTVRGKVDRVMEQRAVVADGAELR